MDNKPIILDYQNREEFEQQREERKAGIESIVFGSLIGVTFLSLFGLMAYGYFGKKINTKFYDLLNQTYSTSRR